jgi:chemotaxis protein histidine kinase CheA
MEFREHAATETAALISRLLSSRAEDSLQQLRAFQAALEAASQGLQKALAKPAQADKEVVDLVDRLTKAASAEAQAAVQAAVQRIAEDARAKLEAANKELKAQAHENEELSAALKSVRAQAELVRTELKTQKERAEQLTAQLNEGRETQKKLEAVRQQADAAIKQEAQARAAAEREVQEARRRIEAAAAEAGNISRQLEAEVAERAKLTERLNAFKNEVHSAEEKRKTITTLYKASVAHAETLEQSLGEVERARTELQAKLDEAFTAQTKLRQHTAETNKDGQSARAEADVLRRQISESSSMVEELLDAFEALAGATGVTDVLATMVERMATQFPRVALFRPKGNRLEGERHVGFDLKTDIAKVAIPLSMDSLITRAVGSGCVESIDGAAASQTRQIPFGGSPTCAIALPVQVHGDTVAVIYADDPGDKSSERTPATDEVRGRFAELLLRHGVARLTGLSTELKALTELREYAVTLLSQTEQMYASDVDSGLTGKDLRSRLADNLECARRLYAQRAAVEGPAAAALLEEELTVFLEDRSSTAFGKDLAKVTAPGEAAKRNAAS